MVNDRLHVAVNADSNVMSANDRLTVDITSNVGSNVGSDPVAHEHVTKVANVPLWLHSMAPWLYQRDEAMQV